MRLATVLHEEKEKIVAAIDDNELIDLKYLAKLKGHETEIFESMLSLIDSGENALKIARELISDSKTEERFSVSEVTFLPPLIPVQYRDCLTFEAHLKNGYEQAAKITGLTYKIPEVWYKQPIYYKGNRMSFIGHGANVEWPHYAEHLDIELEMGMIVGKTGKNISIKDAPSHIFGYTILNDVSARDAQMQEMEGQLGPCKGKDFDTGNILGPYILTADEASHPVSLNMEARVNGVRWGGGNSYEMYHNFADILAHISASETIYAGEVFGSGTVGTGCGLELGKRLNPGDLFELEIEKIGILANKIVK